MGSPLPLLVRYSVHSLFESCNLSRLPVRSAGLSSNFRFMFPYVFQYIPSWFSGRPCNIRLTFFVSDTACFLCAQLFLVDFATSFLFNPRAFPSVFRFAFYVFPSPSLYVVTYVTRAFFYGFPVGFLRCYPYTLI